MKKLCMLIILTCMVVLAWDAHTLAGKLKGGRRRRPPAGTSLRPPLRPALIAGPLNSAELCQDKYTQPTITLVPAIPPYEAAKVTWNYSCTRITYGGECQDYCVILSMTDIQGNLVDYQCNTYYTPPCNGTIQSISYTFGFVPIPGPDTYTIYVSIYTGTCDSLGDYVTGAELEWNQPSTP